MYIIHFDVSGSIIRRLFSFYNAHFVVIRICTYTCARIHTRVRVVLMLNYGIVFLDQSCWQKFLLKMEKLPQVSHKTSGVVIEYFSFYICFNIFFQNTEENTVVQREEFVHAMLYTLQTCSHFKFRKFHDFFCSSNIFVSPPCLVPSRSCGLAGDGTRTCFPGGLH